MLQFSLYFFKDFFVSLFLDSSLKLKDGDLLLQTLIFNDLLTEKLLHLLHYDVLVVCSELSAVLGELCLSEVKSWGLGVGCVISGRVNTSVDESVDCGVRRNDFLIRGVDTYHDSIENLYEFVTESQVRNYLPQQV